MHDVREISFFKKLGLVGTVLIFLAHTGCGGPKAFTKGEYDDPTRVELLDDRYNEADMQQMADTIVKAMVACVKVWEAQEVCLDCESSPKPPIL